MRALLDLVLPSHCPGCGRSDGPGCPRCLADLAAAARWTRPSPAPPGLPAVATVARYDGAVRDLLAAYKEHDAAGLVRPLGAALGRAVALVLAVPPARPAGEIVLIPVPSSPWQRRRRGADVVADLAGVAVRELVTTGRPARVVRALRHVRPMADSAGLDAAARAANAAGALGFRRGAGAVIRGGCVVLVDDLITTGATLAEAARALSAAGATVVGAATVAATGRR